jgi:hypothetical protein
MSAPPLRLPRVATIRMTSWAQDSRLPIQPVLPAQEVILRTVPDNTWPRQTVDRGLDLMDPTQLAWGYRHPGGRQPDQPGLSGVDQGRVDNTFQRLARCSDGMLKNPVRRNARQ